MYSVDQGDSFVPAAPPRTTAKQSRASSTVNSLIEAAIEELEARGESGLRLDTVLSESGASLGSLYHHFTNRDGLIDAARLTQFNRITAADLDIVCSTLSESRSLEDLINRFCFATLCSLSEERAAIRFERIAMLAGAGTRPSLRQGLSVGQNAATTRLTECLDDLQMRGVIPQDKDIRTIAVFMQSFILGQVLTDLDTEETSTSSWVTVVGHALRGILSH
jgi:AcrR family transcriptional regulator